MSIIGVAGLLGLGILWWVDRGLSRRSRPAAEGALSAGGSVDPATGLHTRRVFEDTLQRELHRVQRYKGVLSLALIEIAGLGATVGADDRALSELGSILQGHRAEDLPFRLDTDTFAMILPHTGPVGAMVALDWFRVQCVGRLKGTSVSVGIATTTGGGENASYLWREAEEALAEAKRQGGNAVVSHGELEGSAPAVSASKIAAVRRLLAERQIEIAFQPIWDVQRDALLGYEALMRPADHYGFEGPGEVFEIAEKLGRVTELDEVCLQSALARAVELPPNVLLFINISAQSVAGGQLGSPVILRTLEAVGLTPERVVLEVSERSAAGSEGLAQGAHRLRDQGFLLGWDDVGATNAQLQALRQVQVDFIKIDQQIIVEALVDPHACAVLSGIIAFALRSGCFVIAEGIETQAMLEIVQDASPLVPETIHGVQGAQGFLLGQPTQAFRFRLPNGVVVLPAVNRDAERLKYGA